jgi:uncharacterized protein (UPF0264 family)
MTRLLVSVRNEAEALAAFQGGADWIDLKEPARGALGDVERCVAESIVSRLGGEIALSAAAGELVAWTGLGPPSVYAAEGIRLLKLGLAQVRTRDWQTPWLEIQANLRPFGQQLTPVIYADYQTAEAPKPADVLGFLSSSTCPWVLIDTFDKRAGSLMDWIDRSALSDLLGSIHDRGKQAVVAGRLTADSIATLPLDLIEMIGVRSAACGGDRNGAVDQQAVEKLSAMLHSIGAPP